jgi:glutamate N-acetyltransferase/amino-acid N-acetyltransferase
MSVTFARGFTAAGVTAGFKASGLPDLGLLLGEPGTTAAGLFTTNRVEAAPVALARHHLASGSARAVLVNSGQANAATGERGSEDAFVATAGAAAVLGVRVTDVVPCSTGVIGEPIHMDALVAALPAAAAALDGDGGDGFAHAIMTTDTVDKQATRVAGDHRVGGCAKGVGMIAPNLATMLAFISTDAAVAPGDLQRLADEQLKPRFNAFTVDGCTSTNDTVLLLASGAAGGEPVTPGSGTWDAFAGALADLADDLVAQLIADGEGVTHVLVVDVRGAADEGDARAIARTVADSPLLKTAVFGGDPNPGRVLQAAGAAGIAINPSRIDVAFGDVTVASGGVIPPAYFEPVSALAEDARMQMKDPEIVLTVRVGDGPANARIFGCDLSYDYVRINGEYTT